MLWIEKENIYPSYSCKSCKEKKFRELIENGDENESQDCIQLPKINKK